MKKLLFTIMACVVCLGLVGGAFAYFSDTETSNGNSFTAGTLDLAPGSIYVTGETGYYTPYQSPVMTVTPGGDGVNGYVVFSDIKPGDSGIIYWSITNDGSISGSLDVEITRSVDSDNGFTEPEDMVDGFLDTSDGTADGDLDDYLHIRLEADLNNDGDYSDPGELLQDGTGVGELETYLPVVGTAYEKLSNQTMNPGDVIKFKFAWRLDTDIYDGNPAVNDNIIQGDSFQLDLFFELLQVAD
jgi:predicted ribosomally synthesized peptide with SipW-like signal peptide